MDDRLQQLSPFFLFFLSFRIGTLKPSRGRRGRSTAAIVSVPARIMGLEG